MLRHAAILASARIPPPHTLRRRLGPATSCEGSQRSQAVLFWLSDHSWFVGREEMVQRQLYTSLSGNGRVSVNVTLGFGRLAHATMQNVTLVAIPRSTELTDRSRWIGSGPRG